MKKQRKLIDYVVARLKERSTYLGIVAVLSAAGYVVDQALLDKIIAIGTSVAGLILILTKDIKNDTSRRNRVRKESRKTLQEPTGTSERPGLPVESAPLARDRWGQQVQRKL